jgi:hypothetical protein
MCLPAERTTLGGAQAPTHSFPLRLAPAGTYWWGPAARRGGRGGCFSVVGHADNSKNRAAADPHAPTKQQPTRRTTTTRTTTTKPNHKLLSATRPQPRRRDGGDTTGHALDPFGYVACHMCLPAERTTLGGAQAPTHSFPLRLAPAGTYWWGPAAPAPHRPHWVRTEVASVRTFQLDWERPPHCARSRCS